MRLICLLLIALALFSVANQKAVGFGEFVQGHEQTIKKFKIYHATKGADYLKAADVFVILRSGTILELEGPCGTCTSTSGKAPVCTKKTCKYAKDHEIIKNLLFRRKGAAQAIDSITNGSIVPYMSERDFLYIQRWTQK